MSILSPSAQKIQNLLIALGYDYSVIEHAESTRTAQEAADRAGCELGQIVKSLIFRGKASGKPILVLTSGVNRVDEKRISQYAANPSGGQMPILSEQLPASPSEACLPSVTLKKWKHTLMKVSCRIQPSGLRLMNVPLNRRSLLLKTFGMIIGPDAQVPFLLNCTPSTAADMPGRVEKLVGQKRISQLKPSPLHN
jgi:hypothetical protein